MRNIRSTASFSNLGNATAVRGLGSEEKRKKGESYCSEQQNHVLQIGDS